MGTVAAVEDHHPVTQVFDHLGYPLGSRCFAGTAYGDIADGDDAAVQLASGQEAGFIEPQVHPGAEAVKIGQPPQKAQQDKSIPGTFRGMGHVEDVLDDGRAVFQAAAARIVEVTGVDRIFLRIGMGNGRFLQQIFQVVHGIQGGAPVFPDDLQGGFSHLPAQGIVAGNFQKCFGKAAGVLYGAQGARFAQQGVRVLEVLHAGAHHDGLGMGRRLQYVMAAVVHQAAADKNEIAYGVNTAQFADGINEHHRIFRPGPAHVF